MTDLRTRPASGEPELLPARILDTALALGEQRGWDAVHLHDIARMAGVTLADIRRYFPQKDALAEAWFDRADEAMLGAAEAPEWAERRARERLHAAMFAWLDALAPHRRLTAEMLRYKLQPEHLHLQALGVTRVSRTVQWWRGAAWLSSVGWRREMEEAALTAMYLSTFVFWLRDDSPGAARSRALLERQLAAAERTVQRFLPGP